MRPRSIPAQVLGQVRFSPGDHFLNMLPTQDRIVVAVALGFLALLFIGGHGRGIKRFVRIMSAFTRIENNQ